MAERRIKKKDPAWQHAILSDPNDQTSVTCVFCNKVTKGGIFRHKLHLIGGSTIVAMCLKCPPAVRQEVKDYEEKRKQQKMNYKLPDNADSDNLEAQPLIRKRDSQAALIPSPKKAKEKGPVDSYVQTEPETVVEDPLDVMELERADLRAHLDPNGGVLVQSKDSLTETSLFIEETTSTSRRKRGRPRKVLTDNKNTNEAAFSPVGENTNQRGKKMNQEPEAILKHCTTNVEDNQTLSFAKTSPVWLAVDSMETLKKFPQNPHFAPLNHLREAHREGLAIGHFVTFSTIVEKALMLHCSDPESSFHECLESLNELECHGFDIKPVELHVKKKLLMKEEQEKFREKAKNVEERIKVLSRVNERIDEELMEVIQKLKVFESKRCENSMKVESLRKRVDGMKMAMELSLLDISSL